MFCLSTNVQCLHSCYFQTYTLFLVENILLDKTSRLGKQNVPFVTVCSPATAEHITPHIFLSVSIRTVLTTEITVVTICNTYFNNKKFALFLPTRSNQFGGIMSHHKKLTIPQNPNYAVEGRALTLCIREVPVQILATEIDYQGTPVQFSLVPRVRRISTTCHCATAASFQILSNSIFTIVTSFDPAEYSINSRERR